MARMSDGATLSFYDQLRAIGRTERIDLVLYTGGGDAEAPWRVVTLLRESATTWGCSSPIEP